MTQKILIIDDSPISHAFVRMKMTDESIEFHSAPNGKVGLELAASIQPDLILLDVQMPHLNGFEVCRLLKAEPITMSIPVIFLTGSSSTEEKIKGLTLGAVDYITKPFDIAELRARISCSLRTKYMFDLLNKKAMIDGLTGLWNRCYLDQRLAAELSLIKRTGLPFSCIMADVDHFKSVNDAYGHAFGDDALIAVSRVFTESTRGEDVVCRYGGEEFVLLLPGIDVDGAMILAERLREAVSQLTLLHSEQQVKLTCSFGVANVGRRDLDGASLVRLADEALYAAKRSGRNRVVAASLPLCEAICSG